MQKNELRRALRILSDLCNESLSINTAKHVKADENAGYRCNGESHQKVNDQKAISKLIDPVVLNCFLEFFVNDKTMNGVRTHIDLSNFNDFVKWPVSDLTIRYVTKLVPNIVSLNISGCVAVSNKSLNHLSLNAPNLKDLDISYLKNIKPSGLRAICLRCNIRHLNLSFCPNIDDEFMNVLSCCCSMLIKLIVNGNDQITDLSLVNVFKSCTTLVEFSGTGSKNLGNYGSILVNTMNEHCFNLTILNLSGCSKLKSHGIRNLLFTRNDQAHLKVLKLNSCDMLRLDAFSLEKSNNTMAENSLLQELHVASMQETQLLEPYSFKNLLGLVKLSVANNEFVNNTSLQIICSQLPQLIYLDLDSCSFYDDVGLTVIGKLLKSLKTLILCNNASITINGLTILFGSILYLTTVSVLSCTRINYSDLKRFATRLVFCKLDSKKCILLPIDKADYYINEYMKSDEETQAIRKIVKFFRYLQRLGGVKRLKQEKTKLFLAKEIQALYRAYQRRIKLRFENEKKAQIAKAKKLQAVFRIYKTRNSIFLANSYLLKQKKRGKSVEKISSWYRSRLAKKRWLNLIQEERNRAEMDNYLRKTRKLHILRIQSFVRCLLAKKVVSLKRKLYHSYLSNQLTIKEASICIQCCRRQYISRCLLLQKREMFRMRVHYLKRVVVVQSIFRMQLAKRTCHLLTIEKSLRVELMAATLIQKCWRGLKGRQIYGFVKGLDDLKDRERRDAIKIQAHVRRVLAVRYFESKLLEKESLGHNYKCAVIIQKTIRKFLHTCTINEVQKQFLEQTNKANRVEAVTQQTTTTSKNSTTLKATVLALDDIYKKIRDVEAELFLVARTNRTYYDSNRFGNINQRYGKVELERRLKIEIVRLKSEMERLTLLKGDLLKNF